VALRLICERETEIENFNNEEGLATAAKTKVDSADLSVKSVEAKPVQRKPLPPFQTSTLQQDASRRLGFSATRTMQTAQRLYEGIDIGGETVGLEALRSDLETRHL